MGVNRTRAHRLSGLRSGITLTRRSSQKLASPTANSVGDFQLLQQVLPGVQFAESVADKFAKPACKVIA
jgi:hypothetical protein